MHTRSARLTLLGLAAGILLALLLVPQTRWLVRLPFLALSVLPGRDYPARQRIVEAHSNDLQIQLGGQPQDSVQTPLKYDRSLVARFPNSASLRATLLREATMNEVRLRRDEDNLLEGRPVTPSYPDPNDPLDTPVQLAAFDADAAAGERLDPDNAYFPFMRSVGLFAHRRDTEGLAAVERASQKHIWREYFEDEVEGRWRINNELYGGNEALSASAISAALLFPHYAQLRSAARIVTYKAVLDENAGRTEAGLAKRLMLARVGELMQVKATTLIGNLVGGAIVATAHSRPGGGPSVMLTDILTNDQRSQIRLDAYCTYVVKIGHPEAAAEAQADQQTWQQIHHVTSRIDTYVFGNTMTGLIRIAIAFSFCLTLLPNVFGVVLLGVLAAGLSRLPQIQERRPLPAGAATGFWLTVLLGLLVTGIFVAEGTDHLALSASLAFGLPLAITGILALSMPRLRPRIVTGVTASGIALAVAFVFGSAASWQAVGLAWLGFCCILPVLLLLIFGIVALVKHVPFSVKAIESLRAVMPPLVFGLMLIYGGLTLWTVRQEARANYGLERSLHGEGQYLAQMTGETWPSR